MQSIQKELSEYLDIPIENIEVGLVVPHLNFTTVQYRYTDDVGNITTSSIDL